jgi:predicted polyphosphate/ATP-dependent NAD kinase
MVLIGFVVNPVAGLGGTVGLKGTDGCASEALALGAERKAGVRALAALTRLRSADAQFLTAAGEMGEDVFLNAGDARFEVVFRPGLPTLPEDTRKACLAFRDRGADIILFCGGDGTARDVCAAIGTTVPAIGIPAGVKMYSGVFAVGPAEAASLVETFSPLSCLEGEVMDINEEEYRQGRFSLSFYGNLRVPAAPGLVQLPKGVSDEPGEEGFREEIARFMVSLMVPGTLWILGPGSTTAAITRALGVEKSLLGVDAVSGGMLVGQDLSENGILGLLGTYERVKIVVSPLGSQGFVLGRGNQPISSEVVRRVGPDNIIVVATPQKCAKTPVLYLDTGDEGLNARFEDPVRVVCGYALAQRKHLARL